MTHLRSLPCRRSPLGLLLGLLLGMLLGCGAAQSGEPTTPRRELVIDEPTVVRGQPPLRPGELPQLPQPLESSTESFRRGHALASALLAAEGPGTPPADDAAHAQWSTQSFQPWLTRRTGELQAVVDALAPAAAGAAAERVVAAALVGLSYAQLNAQLVSVPPPARVAMDARLTRIYQSALDAQARAFLEQGSAALAHCAQTAAAQTEAPFGLWLRLCQQERVTLVEHAAQAQLLAELVEAERKADLIVAQGARPPGPEVCWTQERGPSSTTPDAATTAATGAPSTAPTTAPAAPVTTEAAPRCARTPASAAPDPSEPPPSPRDLRYGLRDAATAVRVSAALADADTMNAEPLSEPASRHALAACFAQHVRLDQPVTIALHATLVVDPRGKTRSATLTPEPSDAAAAPSRTLLRCVQSALLRVPFDCSASGQETQARVTYCLRRD